MEIVLILAVVLWVMMERHMILTLLVGLFWFLGGLVALCLLMSLLGVMWCVDTGLKQVVDFLGAHCEELE